MSPVAIYPNRASTKLFFFATGQTHFSFLGNFYNQIDGVAMGSLLAPVLANLFMGHHEKRWLENYNSGIELDLVLLLKTIWRY